MRQAQASPLSLDVGGIFGRTQSPALGCSSRPLRQALFSSFSLGTGEKAGLFCTTGVEREESVPSRSA
eukprot:2892285-Pyramimonas_sp.AAC.1